MTERSRKDVSGRKSRKDVGSQKSRKDFFKLTQTRKHCTLGYIFFLTYLKKPRQVFERTPLGENLQDRP